MKIVSLMPSATEIVCAFGLEEHLVGVTHECDYPPSVKNLPKVTRTLIPHDASSAEINALVRERPKTQMALYSLDMPTLERLQPDLLVTQALCDVCAVAEAEVQDAACRLRMFRCCGSFRAGTLCRAFGKAEFMWRTGTPTSAVRGHASWTAWRCWPGHCILICSQGFRVYFLFTEYLIERHLKVR